MAYDADVFDDAANQVMADIDEWLEQAATAFQSGSFERAADSVWNNQPEEVKEIARKEIPEAAKLLDGIRKKV